MHGQKFSSVVNFLQFCDKNFREFSIFIGRNFRLKGKIAKIAQLSARESFCLFKVAMGQVEVVEFQIQG